MQPYLMMATLIFWTEVEGLVGNCESSMQTDLPIFTRVRGLDKTTYVSPFTWCCTWLHNGVGPGGTGKLVFANPSSIMPMGRGSLPDWRRHAAPLKSPATMSTCSCNITVRTVSISFFPIPRFLTKWLVCSDIMVEKDLPLGGSLRNDAREMTACKNHPDCLR